MQGKLGDPNDIVVEDIWEQYLLSEKVPYVSKQVYVTRSPIKDHECMLQWVEGELKDGKWEKGKWEVRPDLEEWGEELRQYVNLERLKEYPKAWPRKGPRTPDNFRYEVWAKLKLCRKGPNGMDISLSWELAEPGFKASPYSKLYHTHVI